MISVDSEVARVLRALTDAGVTFEADVGGVVARSDDRPSDQLIRDFAAHLGSLQEML